MPAQPLERRLAAARTWAALAETDRTRGRANLHAALGASYDLLLEARDDAASLKGTTPRPRPARARTVVGLVFGGPLSSISRVQLRRYALVLDHAVRLGIGPGRLVPWLDGLIGGHRAAAVAERRARLLAERGGEAAEDRAWAAVQPAIGHFTLTRVDAEFLLLVGRRAQRGVDVIASVPDDPTFTDAALARVRAA